MTRARDRSPRQQSSSLTKRSDSRLLAFSFETSCWEWGRGGGGVAADDAEGGGRAHGGVARQPQVRPAQRAVPPRPPWGSVSVLVFSAVCVFFFSCLGFPPSSLRARSTGDDGLCTFAALGPHCLVAKRLTMARALPQCFRKLSPFLHL